MCIATTFFPILSCPHYSVAYLYCVVYYFLFRCYYVIFFFFFSSRRRHTRCYRDWIQTCALPILLISTTLLVKSFIITVRSSHGYNPANVMVAQLALPKTKYTEESRLRNFSEEVLARLHGLRSEERRVGKECRARWSRKRLRKQKE